VNNKKGGFTMNSSPIRVGLVGCGNAGRSIHMPLFRKHEDLYRVVCCADVMPASAEALAKDFGVRAINAVDALLADAEVELVVVATRPPTTHRDLAVKALRAGKHVVVEKPMAETGAQCVEMIEAAAAAKRVLAVHHNRRWDIDFLTARHVLESGILGDIRLIRNEYAAGFAGSSYDWGIHLIDQTMALSRGRRFIEVSACFCKPDADRPTDSEGFFSARFRTEDGVLHDLSMLPTFDGNAFRPGQMPYRFMLAGTDGIVYQEWCQRPEDAFNKPVFMRPAKPGKGLGDLPFVSAELRIPDFYQALHGAIRSGGPVPVSGADGHRAVRAWELIGQSATAQKTLSISL
jgi:scyllo-inositol 2-dehydrogenase (NADP+)